MIKANEFIAILLEEKPLFDPDMPADAKAEINRLLPTKTVRLGGNSMIYAPGVIAMAQRLWKTRSRKDRKTAYDIIHSWSGLEEEDYRRILDGNADITPNGDGAVIVIKLWK